MTNTLPDAAALAVAANRAFVAHADRERPDDWTDVESYDRFRTVLLSGSAWKVNAHSIVATVADTNDGRIWGYVASDVLDSVGQDLSDSAHIEQLAPTVWCLSW